MEVFYLKVNLPFATTQHYLVRWLDIIKQFAGAKVYVVCDKPELSKSITDMYTRGGGYNFTIIPSARDSDELRYIIDSAIVENWKPAAYAHFTTFLHARDNGYKSFWNIDADDTGLYAKPRKIAKIFKRVKDYSRDEGINILSLDYWTTLSAGTNWSFGVTYTDNSVDWIELFKKHCKDDAHTEHYKRLGIPNNADELTNYLRKVEDVKAETFYVENLHMIHHSSNVYFDPHCGVKHWANGRCYWHIMSESFGMGESGALPIPECMIKFDIGLTAEDSAYQLKNSYTSSFIKGFIRTFEKTNRVVDETVTLILPLDGAVEDVRMFLGNLLRQTFTDFRLIVTDVGIAKGALKICREFESAFNGHMEILTDVPKEKLLSVGLQTAKGRYVMLVNGADVLLPEALMSLVVVAENSRADVVHTSNYLEPIDEGKFLLRTDEPGWSDDINSLIILPGIEERIGAWLRGMIAPSIHNHLIRREFLEEEKFSIPSDTAMNHWAFGLQCLCLAEKFVRVATPLYARFFRVLEKNFYPVDSAKNFEGIEYGKRILNKIIDDTLFMNEYTAARDFLRKHYADFATNALRKYLLA